MKTAESSLSTIRRELRSAALRADSAETSLNLAEAYGSLCWQNNDGFLSDDALEASLTGKFASTLRDHNTPKTSKKTVRWLHVLSQSYSHGGHSRMALSLMAEQAKAGESLAVMLTRATCSDFAEACANMGVPLEVVGGSLLDRARAVYRRAVQAEVLVLHIHPDDIGAALGARLAGENGTRVLFINHADHVFSYGSGAAGAVMEISGYGWRQTVLYRKARAQCYLGIPVDVFPAADPVPASVETVTRTGPVLSIGSPAKYMPDGRNDFPAFVSNLLDRCDRSFEFIGPDGTEPWWRAAVSRHGDRIRFNGYMPYAAANERLQQASAYVDSFPIAGGTAFPQALLAGIPVFGLADQSNGYGPLDSLRSPSTEVLLDELVHYLDTGTEDPTETAMREKLRKESSSAACNARLTDAANRILTDIPPEMVPTSRNQDSHRQTWLSGNSIFVPYPAQAPLALRVRFALRSLTNSRLQASIGRRKMVSWLFGAQVKGDLAPSWNSGAAVGWKPQVS